MAEGVAQCACAWMLLYQRKAKIWLKSCSHSGATPWTRHMKHDTRRTLGNDAEPNTPVWVLFLWRQVKYKAATVIHAAYLCVFAEQRGRRLHPSSSSFLIGCRQLPSWLFSNKQTSWTNLHTPTSHKSLLNLSHVRPGCLSSPICCMKRTKFHSQISSTSVP